MKVLSNSDRMMLLCEIGQGEKCVSELEDALDLHQPTLSQQLTVLRKEKLVKTRREGKQIYYSLASEIVVSVISLLYKHYCKR
jgi:ArsR family transcriptional regulator